MIELIFPILDDGGRGTLLAALLLALLLDGLIGDPAWLYSRLPHPVVLIGQFITGLELSLNRSGDAPWAGFVKGLLLCFVVISAVGAAGLGLSWLFAKADGGWVLTALCGSTLLSGRDLFDHVRAVVKGLSSSLTEGRLAVANIVGRDPDSLDEAGVSRATLESLAENFSDGVVAPVFWFVVAGLPGLVIYKAINTMDSMIGHHNTQYEWFGKAVARLDDGVNLLPARFCALLILLAAAALPGYGARAGFRALRRDANRHRSINAGVCEAAMAGALGIRLAGPRHYGGEMLDDAWMGDGRDDLGAVDIKRGLRLYLTANAILAALVLIFAITVWL